MDLKVVLISGSEVIYAETELDGPDEHHVCWSHFSAVECNGGELAINRHDNTARWQYVGDRDLPDEIRESTHSEVARYAAGTWKSVETVHRFE